MSDEIKVCKGTMADQVQSMINNALELLSEVGMQVCNMLFSICHTFQKAAAELLAPWKDFLITTEDADNIKGLLIKGPTRHKFLPFSVLRRMASRELHNLLTFTSNGDQIKFQDMAKVIRALSTDADEMVAARIVATTTKEVQATADPNGRADIITTCKKLINAAKIPLKSGAILPIIWRA